MSDADDSFARGTGGSNPPSLPGHGDRCTFAASMAAFLKAKLG
jgi:hypothetical protein